MAPEELRLVPTLLNDIVAIVPVEVNLYHTSSSGVPVAHPTGILLLVDAPHRVPELLAVPEVKAMAPVHSSFAGGAACVIQMLNVASLAGNPAAHE
jgi:hypothetical protein